MLKTYIDVPRQDYTYYMVHDLITLDNGWDVLTTVYKPNYVRFYFSYKWFQYGKIRALKMAVKNYETYSTYYDITTIPRYNCKWVQCGNAKALKTADRKTDDKGAVAFINGIIPVMKLVQHNGQEAIEHKD